MATSNTRHYHVTVSFGGLYLPNNNYLCRTLAEAYAIAKDEKDAFLDYGRQSDYQYSTIKVTGDIRQDRHYDVWQRYSRRDEWSHWQMIDIDECDESDCYNASGELYSE